MKKRKIITVLFLFVSFIFLHAENEDINLAEVNFEGKRISEFAKGINAEELNSQYNIAYSPFLPAGGVYSITNIETGKKAIIQIGLAQVNHSPYIIYLPDYTFDFLTNSSEAHIKSINLKIKFLAWNKEGENSFYLDLQSLIVTPENSTEEINKNGLNQYYIQLGAFSYFQNSYPVIIDMMPYFKLYPKFYLIKKEVVIRKEKKEIYRVMAGPFSIETANNIVNEIKQKKSKSVFVHSGASIIEDIKCGERE